MTEQRVLSIANGGAGGDATLKSLTLRYFQSEGTPQVRYEVRKQPADIARPVYLEYSAV